MKKNLRNLLVLVLLALCTLSITGCVKSDKEKIGILQLATHEALDNTRIGFIKALEEAGYKDGENIEIIVKNPEGDLPTCGLMATELVRDCDLVLGIATDAAVALQSASLTENKTDLPILFTAVTDPVDAGLVDSLTAPEANITGTSDMNPVAEQVALIKEIIPACEKIGIVYNISEPNSKVQADMAKEEAEKEGLEVVIRTVTEASEISPTITSLSNSGIEALYLPTDNLLAKNMASVANVAEESKILVVCGESGMVKSGGSISYSIDYVVLGEMTGEMAVPILKGDKTVGETPIGFLPTSRLAIAINEENFQKIGLEVPASLKNKKDVTVGILQLATHSALDNTRESFVKELEAQGYIEGENLTLIVKNPEGDPSICGIMATDLVRKCDLVLGIATDAAVALQTAAINEGKTDLPVLFTAVTDPVAAGLVDSITSPEANVTGTSDMNPVAEQIALIKEIIPNCKKVGIMYNISEPNSKVQSDMAKAEAEKNGLTVVIKTVSEASEIAATINSLVASGIEALYLPTDNLVAKNMATIAGYAEDEKILVVCGESSLVDNGGSITFGIDYEALGKLTGEMAVAILDGVKTVAQSPVGYLDASKLAISVNEANFEAIGLEIPQSIKERMNK